MQGAMFGAHLGPGAVDNIKAVLGAADLTSTKERKYNEKQQRLAYGQQLQQQMEAQQERKKAERMERMGIPMQPSSPGPGMGMGMGAGSPPGSFNNAPPAAAAPNMFSPQPASFSHMQPPMQQGFMPPSFNAPMQPHMQQPMQPPMQQGMGWMGGMPMGMAPQPMQIPPGPPQYGGGNFGPPSPNSMGAGGPMMGGFGGGMMHQPQQFAPPPQPPPQPMMMPRPVMGLANQGLGPQQAAIAKQQEFERQNAYRAELDAQMRAKEERKRAEKEASMQEARARQAMAAVADYQRMQGGGGAPHRDPSGNVMADLRGMNSPYGPPSPHGGPPFMGGPPPPGPMMGFPQPPGGSPPRGMPGPFGGPPPFDGGPPPGMMGGGPQQFDGGGGGMGGGGGAPGGPVFRFRSNNPYATPAEMDAKARQRAQLQEALEAQIAEKKYKKDLEKQKELDEIMREESRLRAEQERLKEQFQQEKHREGGKQGEGGDPVAAAWAKAKEEAEEAKRQQYAARRGGKGGRGSMDGMPSSDQLPLETPAGPPPPMADPPVFAPMVAAPAPVPSGLTAQQVEERAKAVAQAEIERVRQELNAESNSLRGVVQEQSAQVAALKQHAERMEEKAERAQEQVHKMRVDMIRSSVAMPESMMRIMSDYPMHPLADPPPSMLDIALDLPPPAAVQRRAVDARGGPVYDMGPIIQPVHNPGHADPGLQRQFLASPGAGPARPPTQGLRTINPLEASMACESVFIYPNGREVPKGGPLAHAALSPAAHAQSGLPFKSLVISESQPLQGSPTSPGAAFSPGAGASMGGQGTLLSPGAVLSPDGPVDSFTTVGLAAGGAPILRDGSTVLNPGPLPPGTADAVQRVKSQLQAEAEAAAAAAATAATPMDVENLMARNRDKLNMLKELTTLSSNDSVEAIDAFLNKFARTQPGLPERTRTPVLRIHTPQGANAAPGTASYAASAGYNPQHQALARPTSKPHHGPIPLPPATQASAANSKSGTPLAPPQSSGSAMPHKPPSPSADRLHSGGNLGNLGRRASHDMDATLVSRMDSITITTKPPGSASSHQPPRSPILFTDNYRPASGGTLGTAGGASKPATPKLGDYLDPKNLAKKDMLPGPGLLARPPSHGRRASSANTNTSSPQVGAGGGAAAQVVPATPTRAVSAGRMTPVGRGDSLDAFAQQAGSGLRSGSFSGVPGVLQGAPRSPMISRQWSSGSRQGGDGPGWGAGMTSGSRPPSGIQPMDGALSSMPLPRALSGGGSRAGSAGRRASTLVGVPPRSPGHT